MTSKYFRGIDITIEAVLKELELKHLAMMKTMMEIPTPNMDKLGSSNLYNVPNFEIDDFINDLIEVDKLELENEILKEYAKHPEVDIIESVYKRDVETKNKVVNRLVQLIDFLFKPDNGVNKEDDAGVSFLKDFKITNRKDKTLLNLLGLVNLLSRIRELGDIEEEKEVASYFANEVKSEIDSLYRALLCINVNKLKSKVETLEANAKWYVTENSNKDKKITSLNQNLKQYQEQISVLTKEVKEAKSHPGNPELINQLYKDIQSKDAQINKLSKEISSSKEKSSKVHEGLIQTLNDRILELRKTNDEKKAEIRKLKSTLKQYENTDMRNSIIEYLSNNQLDEGMYAVVSNAIFRYGDDIREQKSVEVNADVTEHTLYRIGFCLIERNVHYIMSPNEPKQEILNIPENIYLGKGQFLCVDNNGHFKWHYPSFVEYPDNEKFVNCYSPVTLEEGIPYINRGMGRIVKVKNLSSGIVLRDKQIISVDANDNFIRYYKQVRINADTFMESAKAKGQTLGFVLKALPNGYYIRDVETGNESFATMKPAEDEIEEKFIMAYKDDVIVNVIRNSRFYTNSSYYKNTLYGAVELRDDNVFVKKMTGELVIINNIPPLVLSRLSDGDVIGFDEFYDYVSYKENQSPISTSSNIIKRKVEDRDTCFEDKQKEKFKALDNGKTVVVIGNSSYAPNYSQALLSKGYTPKFVDGYESWIRIVNEIRASDIVVVITEFISHDNMFRVKKEIMNVPVVYSQHSGANRILDEISKLNHAFTV